MNKTMWNLLRILLMCGVVIPLIIILLQHVLSFGWFSEASNDGWLGFWGGFLGAIISTLGVYKSVEKQNVMERAIDIENARPRLIVKENFGNAKERFKTDRVIFNNKYRFNDENIDALKIYDELELNNEHWLMVRNDSNNAAFNCTLLNKTTEEEEEKIYEVGNILPGQTVHVISSKYEWSKKMVKSHILLEFTTEKNELVIYDAHSEKSLYTSSNKEVEAYNGDKMINRKEHFSKII